MINRITSHREIYMSTLNNLFSNAYYHQQLLVVVIEEISCSEGLSKFKPVPGLHRLGLTRVPI